MVASPNTPANLPILYTHFPHGDRRAIPTIASKILRIARTLCARTLRPNDLAYQWSRNLPTTVLLDHKAFRHHPFAFCQLGVAIVMNCSQRFAFFYSVTDAFVK